MCEAVAGAAAVGASVNPGRRGRRALPARWLATEPLPTGDEELVEKSRQVLRRAVRSHDNEWWELWDEAGLADDVDGSCRRALGLARRPRRLSAGRHGIRLRTRDEGRAGEVRCGAGPPSPCRGWWRGRRRSARRPGCAAAARPCRPCA